jgi:hypothetical protein
VKKNQYVICGAVALASVAVSMSSLSAQRGRGGAEGGEKPNPVHVHIGHVMTAWKEVPTGQGFLPVAVGDAKIAQVHAGYMQKAAGNLDQIKMHAGHVINALDPTIEPKGPGSFGVKRAAAGALTHAQNAAKAEGASKGVLTHTEHVSASLENVGHWTDQAVATAQKIRAATSAADTTPLITELIAQLNTISNGIDANKDGTVGWQIGEGGLAQAQQHMTLMMKGEGLVQ